MAQTFGCSIAEANRASRSTVVRICSMESDPRFRIFSTKPECAGACPHRTGCAITCTAIAAESMSGGVGVNRHLGIRLRDCVDLALRDVLVLLAEMKNDGTFRPLV